MEEKFNLLDIKDPKIKTLHYTWIAFFITFYVWFNMAPLATNMLNSVDWLTKEHLKILAICNVALTIPGRIIIGALIDKYGPRIVFSGLMVVMAIPALIFAFGNSFMQLLISRLVLGTIGAGFVIGIKMTAIWFPKSMIGRAEGFYAGWGNFGSAAAAMTLPWIAFNVFDDWLGFNGEGWRYALAFNGGVSLVYGIMYYFLVTDHPLFYDFFLHTFFLGFAFSMIWAHAPIIFPAILKTTQRPYHPILWVWWGLFQITLIGRTFFAWLENIEMRKLLGGVNGVIILLMFATMAITMVYRLRKAGKSA